MTRRRAHPRGFTLLELVLVMVIVCVALAAAAPSLRGFWAGRRTDDAARELLAATTWAHSQSVADGQVYRLLVDRQLNQYTLRRLEQGAWVELGTYAGRIRQIPEDMRINLTRADGAGVDYIDFFPNGRTEPAIIEVIPERSEPIRIVCLTPTETFHIQDASEVRTR